MCVCVCYIFVTIFFYLTCNSNRSQMMVSSVHNLATVFADASRDYLADRRERKDEKQLPGYPLRWRRKERKDKRRGRRTKGEKD